MTHHKSIGSSNHEKDKQENLCYSVSLLDMASSWERDIEINLRFLQFPIIIKLALCFAPPTPIEHTITCHNAEVLLLVEAALFSRLQDFCIDNPPTSSESSVSSSMKSNVTINKSDQPNEMNSTDNKEEATIEEILVIG
ncbi:13354_t:CDS:2 [Funneliformis geosporum]|uniref:7782_t:CDS:1 n=1 Tax=Funneliformis geosporum TaxID=1117311 RepID=A0A9W4WL68_9GLOM|nr:7782_t:CDS:2 [Funneliformis geosporum]CAI2195609.1 13354_t:CDS:2 [Funneliformis geosporum]